MASVTQVNGKWRALVRRRGHKPQCRTFANKSAANAWAREIESAIDRGEAVGTSALTVGQVIESYRKLRAKTRPIPKGATEQYMLAILDKYLGDKVAARLTPDDLVAFAMTRRDDGAGPWTVNQDLSKLGTIFRYGGALLNTVLPDVVGAARPTLNYLRLIGSGNKRDRRPTPDELERVLAYFAEHHGQGQADALAVLAITAMRAGEVTDLKWADLNPETRIAEVLRKHPRKGKTLEKVPLLGVSWEIIQAQPRDGDLVFPFLVNTLSLAFTRACRKLGIDNLHLHDLRHEGTSAMFEQGYSIEQVALVTGHKTWAMLRRYTNLRPEDLTAN